MPRLIEAEQRSPEWFAARAPLITASDFDKIMAAPTTAKYQDYIASKAVSIVTGVVEEGYTSKEMEWGNEYEDTAWLMYALQTGNDVEETGLMVHDTLRAGASLDRVISGKRVGESKCPKSSTHIKTLQSGKVPSAYKPQVQGQLWVSGFKDGDFISYDPRMPENAQLAIVKFERDEEYIADLESKVIKALQDIDKQVELIKNYKG